MVSARNSLICILTLCAYQPAGADPAPGAPKRQRVNKCIKAGSPIIAKLKWAGDKRTRAAYAAALRRRGLKKARIGPQTVTLHRGIRGRPHQRGYRAGRMVTATIRGKTGRYLAGGSYWSGQPGLPHTRELITDGKGNYYFARRLPRPVARRLTLCGCAQLKCGPYGSGCPACGATIQFLYGPFGPGDRFRGELKIVYPSYTVTTQFQQGRCARLRRCPAPPPSMPR